jgi:hypothetical protein
MKTDKAGFTATDGQVKRVLRFNIGLNNNRYSVQELLEALGDFMDIDSHFIVEGEYNGDNEPTLVATGLSDLSLDIVQLNVSLFSMLANQDCIAFRLGGQGDLAYRSDWTGDRYEFNEEYFI